jgi:hypothetical protein
MAQPRSASRAPGRGDAAASSPAIAFAVAQVLRDYGMNERAEAPADSRRVHGG